MREPQSLTEIILKAYRRLYGGAYYISTSQLRGAVSARLQ
jgi:hypothetical protein